MRQKVYQQGSEPKTNDSRGHKIEASICNIGWNDIITPHVETMMQKRTKFCDIMTEYKLRQNNAQRKTGDSGSVSNGQLLTGILILNWVYGKVQGTL